MLNKIVIGIISELCVTVRSIVVDNR